MAAETTTIKASVRTAFAVLVAVQATHSIEEAATRLWEVWGPAAAVSRFVGDLFGAGLPGGFAIVNSAFVLFGFWCYLFRVRASAPSAVGFLWLWTLIALANGIFHSWMALDRGGYFPGVVTAPFLAITALYLAGQLITGSWIHADPEAAAP